MATLRNKNEPLRLFFRRVGTLALLVVVVAVAIAVWNIYKKERESRILRTQAELQQEELSAQAGKLRDETAKLKTERGQEEAFREQYDVGKKGESLIVIVEPQQPKPLEATSTFMQKLKKALLWW